MHYSAKSIINDRYSVTFPIKQGAYAETYRVRDTQGRRCFLKLIDCSLLQPHQLDTAGDPIEVKIMEELNHPHLPIYIDSGKITIDGHPFSYVVTDYLSSETLADHIARSITLRVYEAKQIVLGLLEAVAYLHSRQRPIIHNEISALNVLINLSCNGPSQVRLIDFGHACHLDEAFQMPLEGLNWFYLAPECLEGYGSKQTDLYAVGAVLYLMLFGMLPWFCDLSNVSPDHRRSFIISRKNTELPIPLMEKFELDNNLLTIVHKALAADPDQRFQTAEEMAEAIRTNAAVTVPTQRPATLTTSSTFTGPLGGMHDEKSGGGFADVAGMASLKELLVKSVINVLRDTEKAKRYKLQIPNGILLYGPPGCGKSFLAEKFAEEAGYHFRLVKASDLASTYIHGSQEKIGALFAEAAKNAPTILCFDEFDAVVPARGQKGHEYQSGEVNEFLSQLNNCSERGIFVIASTNRPDVIDPAVLRRGRIDKVIYIPLPDAECRTAMFEKHLQGRPFDATVSCNHLASLTDGYIASDIAYIVNEAAARAAFSDEEISQATLEEVIAESKPSLSAAAINEHQRIREKMEGLVEQRRRIGF